MSNANAATKLSKQQKALLVWIGQQEGITKPVPPPTPQEMAEARQAAADIVARGSKNLERIVEKMGGNAALYRQMEEMAEAARKVLPTMMPPPLGLTPEQLEALASITDFNVAPLLNPELVALNKQLEASRPLILQSLQGALNLKTTEPLKRAMATKDHGAAWSINQFLISMEPKKVEALAKLPEDERAKRKKSLSDARTRALRELEKRGLITRANEGHELYVKLTSLGRKVCRELL